MSHCVPARKSGISAIDADEADPNANPVAQWGLKDAEPPSKGAIMRGALELFLD
jgi:hypothetical protein